MAAVAPSADQAVGLLQKLSLDSQPKTFQVPESANKPSGNQYAPVNSGTLVNGLNKPLERCTTPVHQDFMGSTVCYLPDCYPSAACYYGGYDGSGNEWVDYTRRYGNPEGIEMPYGVYGDNGSHMYQYGYGPYGYASYSAYHPPGSPVPSMGHDGQLYGPQHYQYPTSYHQSLAPTSGSLTSNQENAPQAGVSTSTEADQSSVANVGNVNGTNVSKPLRSNYQNLSSGPNSSYGRERLSTGITYSGYQDPRFTFDGTSANPWLDGGKSKHSPVSCSSNCLVGRNQNLRPYSHLTGLQRPRAASRISQADLMGSMYQNNRMLGQYANTFGASTVFGLNGYDSRSNGWRGVQNNYKPKGRGNVSFGYANENVDGLNELNRGPRAKGFENQKDLEPITLAMKGQIPFHGNDYEDKASVVPEKERYSREDLPDTYSDAKFFVIKSYSEDDVHKSVKYGVWASTPNGNEKLDAAYHEAQSAAKDCPVFLFFSVNASGQFVGIAEMVGTVDFNKSMEYWQQDKWTGCFPVKWHVVKDVPNSSLKHIMLENNENKPVTNSRDTQEVKFVQGIEMLKIFKAHSSQTCVLDDFGFYEARQKILQERKAKQQQLNKQLRSREPIDAVVGNGSIGKQNLQMSLNVD